MRFNLKKWKNKFAIRSGRAGLFKKLIIATLLLGGGGIIAGSTYSIVEKFSLGGDYVDGYLGRVQLNPFTQPLTSKSGASNQKFGTFIREGKEYNFDNPNVLNNSIDQAIKALTLYNNDLGERNFTVHFSNLDSVQDNNATRLLNLYFNAPSLKQIDNNDPLTKEAKPKVDFNHNNAWFKYVALNQLSIDRYGFDYNNDGSATTSNSPKIEKLVTFNDVGTTNAKLLTESQNGFDGIAFNIYSKNIPASQIKILANTNSNLFTIPSQFTSTVNNNWFVWLDKDILAFKLNYIYQTYVFHQNWALSSNQVHQIVGNPNINNGQTEQQKQNYEKISQNFYALNNDETKFAEDYLKIVVNNNSGTTSDSDAVDRATRPDRFISSDNLNSIYNAFIAHSGSTTLFNNYLLTLVKGGTGGNWQKFFPKYDPVLNKNFSENLNPTDIKTIAPIRALNASNEIIDKPPENVTTSTSTPPAASESSTKETTIPKKIEKYVAAENVIHVSVDSALSPQITNSNLFDRITKYQIQFFPLRQKIVTRNANNEFVLSSVWTSGIYAPGILSTNLEAASLNFAPPVAGRISDSFSNFRTYWLQIAAILIFIILIGIIVSVLYRIPGLITFIFWVASMVASMATFFGFNLTLTTDAATGILATVLISGLGILYALNYFIKQVQAGSSLRQAKNHTFIRSTLFNFDIYTPTFFTGVLFAFVGLAELHGFGFYLSVGTFIPMLILGVLANLTNWLIVDVFYDSPRLFLSKKNRAFLKSLTGELNVDSDIAKKLVTKKYTDRRYVKKNEDQLIVNLFNWKTWVYFLLTIIILIVGISIIFVPSIGFGSSFILKNGVSVNYSLDHTTILGGKTLEGAQTALTPDKIAEFTGVNFQQDLVNNHPDVFFLRTTQNFDFDKLIKLFNQWLQPNSYSVQETIAFSSQSTINAAFITITLSLAIMSVYYAVRFNWTSIFQLWLTTFLTLGLSVAIIAIIRITVDRNITGAILVIYVISLITNSVILNFYRENFRKWHFYSKDDFYKLVSKTVKNNYLFYLLFLFMGILSTVLGAVFNWLELQNLYIYIIIGLMASFLIIIPFGTILWKFSMQLRQKLFYNDQSKGSAEHVLTLKYKVKSHDKIDEQLIPGINIFNP